MTVNFECKNCIHFPVCELKHEAEDLINECGINRIKEDESFKINLNCKYYGNKNHNVLCK